MAHMKILTPEEILKTALRLLENDSPNGLSLRSVASALGVKAPSLYRYFPQKGALEAAAAEEACRMMLTSLEAAAAAPEPDRRFLAVAEAYLQFARERFPLYAYITGHLSQTYGHPVSKAVWNLLLEAASGVSGRADDTSAAVATWSFLHGYALLEQAGAFGASGPRGGLERGLEAFLTHFKAGNKSFPKATAAPEIVPLRSHKPSKKKPNSRRIAPAPVRPTKDRSR